MILRLGSEGSYWKKVLKVERCEADVALTPLLLESTSGRNSARQPPRATSLTQQLEPPHTGQTRHYIDWKYLFVDVQIVSYFVVAALPTREANVANKRVADQRLGTVSPSVDMGPPCRL